MSRELIRQFTASGYFTVVRHAGDHGEIDRYLDSGKAQIAVLIPADFSRNIRTGKEASLQVIVDGSDSNTATIALGYVSIVRELCLPVKRRENGSP